LISDARRGRFRCHKCQLEVVDDPVHHREIRKESDDLHLVLAAIKRIPKMAMMVP
jgi:hypothetical protein